MFQFPAFPSYTLLYSCMDNLTFSQVEFPHSEIHGLKDICSYPWLIAAYHVLLRLLVPRHSPYALSSLTYDITFSVISANFSFLECFRLIVYYCMFPCASLPSSSIYIFFNVLNCFVYKMVEVRRVELLTSCLQGRRSSQLSYTPIQNNI